MPADREKRLSEAWEEHAAKWIAWARAPGHDSYWQFHRDAFMRVVPPPGRRTLDLGCGEGRVTRDLAARGHRVAGIDASPTLVAAAREAHPAGEYLLAAAEALPFDDDAFDLVIAFMSLHDMDDIEGALRQCARVLSKNGRLVAAVVHPLNSAGSFEDEAADSPFVIRGSYLDSFAYADEVERAGLSMTFHCRHRSLEAYSRAFEGAGLLIEAMREPPARGEGPPSERTQQWLRLPLFLHMIARRAS